MRTSIFKMLPAIAGNHSSDCDDRYNATDSNYSRTYFCINYLMLACHDPPLAPPLSNHGYATASIT